MEIFWSEWKQPIPDALYRARSAINKVRQCYWYYFWLCSWQQPPSYCKVGTMAISRDDSSLRSGFSIVNQIKSDLQFTDLWLTWCSEWILNQLCFVFSCIFDLQLHDRRLADRPSTEPNWLADSDLDLQCRAKLPSMRCEWVRRCQ